MILAHLAGIRVFATGGLGGVHRGVESSMDISADLTEMGRTPVAVISSGCKSFLDIPKTLEYLETEGASVATFADGREGKVDFPAFWSRDSGVTSPLTIQNEMEAAAMICKTHTMMRQYGNADFLYKTLKINFRYRPDFSLRTQYQQKRLFRYQKTTDMSMKPSSRPTQLACPAKKTRHSFFPKLRN